MKFVIHSFLISAGLLAVACNSANNLSTPSVEQQTVGLPARSFASGHESVVANFELTIDTATLSAQVTPIRTALAQPPQAIYYDLDIDQFLKGDSFRVSQLETQPNGDLRVDFTHAHPFDAPDFTAPVTGMNRADLGYTAKLLILSSSDVHSRSFFSGISADPSLITDPDGYSLVGDLLRNPAGNNTVYPYVLLADDGQDNRVGVSNGGNPEGNFDAAVGGWQRSNIGPESIGWTGYDFVHGGQTVTNSFTVAAERLESTVSLPLAILIKYTDPRGDTDRGTRFPPEEADVFKFAYRAPVAAFDNSKITLPNGPLTIGNQPEDESEFRNRHPRLGHPQRTLR